MADRPLHDRIYRAILRLFPREFRGDFGEQMEADFRDQRRDVTSLGPRAAVRLWARTLGGVFRRAPSEHLDVLRQDVSFALRMLRRTPGAAAAIVLTIAVGVGSATAVFTLADPMLFRPLPYAEADRLVRVSARADRPLPAMHVADFLRAEATHQGFQAIAAFSIAITGQIEGRAESAMAYQVTRGFFDVLQVRPLLGREFLPDEYRVSPSPDVAILTYGFWQSAFGGREDVLEQPLELSGLFERRFRIVGVLPRGFILPEHSNRAPDFLVPYAPDPATQGNPNQFSFPVARLAPGVSREAAAAEMQALLQSLEAEYPAFAQGRQAVIRDLRDVLFGQIRTPLLMLLAATGCVLLLACANLAQLFMSRLQARRREFGVRLALGAGRWRLVRLLTIESAIYALLGGSAALVLGQWTFDLIMARTPEFAHVYRLLPARVDVRVVVFSAALAGLALLLVGAIPAFRASRLDIRGALLDGGATTGARRRLTGDAALVFVQCAVAMALAVAGALLVHSFARLAYQPLGFDPDRVQAINIQLPGERLTAGGALDIQERRRLYEHLRARLSLPVTLAGGWPAMHLPGVMSAAGAGPDAPQPIAYPAAGTMFDVFGIRLAAGRLYSDAEAFGNAPVAVIDRLAADRLWPGQDPLGRIVVDADGAERHVIGVVDTLRTHLTSTELTGTAFIPFAPTARAMNLAVRAPDGGLSADELRAAVHDVAPGARVTLWPLRPFERTLGQPRFLAALLGTLNVITLILAAVGIFGVVNHGAAKRSREVGIRMALGATAARIRRMVLAGALLPALLGMAAGAGVALWWTPTLRSLLFGIEPADPLTYAAAAALVTLVVLAGSLLPAWRASRVPPVVALRAE
jgi:putative ABC transport system permease protein